jgi:hypothetical protein
VPRLRARHLALADQLPRDLEDVRPRHVHDAGDVDFRSPTQ